MAYDSLPLKDAATLLFFTTNMEILNFAQQANISFQICPAVLLTSLIAGMASRPDQGRDHIHAEG